MTNRLSAAAGAAVLLAASGASAAEVKIFDIKAYMFLEKTGHLSANIADSKEAFKNVSTGGGPGGEAASGILVEFVFAGDKNSAPKYASALINITQSGKNGQKAKTTKAFGGFQFGDSGEVHKALFLENATCMPLEIEVKAGKSTKTAKIEFACDELVEVKGPGLAPTPDGKAANTKPAKKK